MGIIKVIILLSVLSKSLVSSSSNKPYVEDVLIDKITKKYKQYAKIRFIKLQDTLDKIRKISDLHKLKMINNFYNNVRYASDKKIYKVSDYWANPYEFLGKDKGDCEDYVISKYFALEYLGIDSKKLFFTYVKSSKFKETHMVLTYFRTPKSEPLVLDNINHKIFLASKRKDLIPIYNFNPKSLKKSHKKVHKKWDILYYNFRTGKI